MRRCSKKSTVRVLNLLKLPITDYHNASFFRQVEDILTAFAKGRGCETFKPPISAHHWIRHFVKSILQLRIVCDDTYNDLTKCRYIEISFNIYSQNLFVDLNSFSRAHLTRVLQRGKLERRVKSSKIHFTDSMMHKKRDEFVDNERCEQTCSER